MVFIGYYLFASLIYLPTFERQLQADALRKLLEQVSARLRAFFGGSLLVFLVTGTYLMLINKNYLGLGNFFANPWSTLMVIKHVLMLQRPVLRPRAPKASRGVRPEAERDGTGRRCGCLRYARESASRRPEECHRRYWGPRHAEAQKT